MLGAPRYGWVQPPSLVQSLRTMSCKRKDGTLAPSPMLPQTRGPRAADGAAIRTPSSVVRFQSPDRTGRREAASVQWFAQLSCRRLAGATYPLAAPGALPVDAMSSSASTSKGGSTTAT